MPSHSNGDNMARYTDQQTFTYSPKREDLILLTNANGGSLTIEAWTGAEWVTTDTVSTTGAQQIAVKGLKVRFTPSGGMVYKIAEGH